MCGCVTWSSLEIDGKKWRRKAYPQCLVQGPQCRYGCFTLTSCVLPGFRFVDHFLPRSRCHFRADSSKQQCAPTSSRIYCYWGFSPQHQTECQRQVSCLVITHPRTSNTGQRWPNEIQSPVGGDQGWASLSMDPWSCHRASMIKIRSLSRHLHSCLAALVLLSVRWHERVSGKQSKASRARLRILSQRRAVVTFRSSDISTDSGGHRTRQSHVSQIKQLKSTKSDVRRTPDQRAEQCLLIQRFFRCSSGIGIRSFQSPFTDKGGSSTCLSLW
jgi:hypothetical protein